MSRSSTVALAAIFLSSFWPAQVEAEIPLPDAVFFGTVRTDTGAIVDSGELVARVSRAGRGVLNVSGEFVSTDGGPVYVVRVPMETDIGAPSAGRDAAREGDSLVSMRLNGEELTLSSDPTPLASGALEQIDATGGDVTPSEDEFLRGDCNNDAAYNLSDALSVLGFLFLGHQEPECKAACDANGDETLVITDAVFILLNLFSGGESPAPPSGECGVPPQVPVLSCDASACSV